MQQRIIVENQDFEMNKSSHLRRKRLKLIVAQVQMKKVGEIDEQLRGHILNPGIIIHQSYSTKGL